MRLAAAEIVWYGLDRRLVADQFERSYLTLLGIRCLLLTGRSFIAIILRRPDTTPRLADEPRFGVTPELLRTLLTPVLVSHDCKSS